MSGSYTIEIDPAAILATHHLGAGGDAWQRAGELVRDYCAEFAPWKTGNLAQGSVTISASGSTAEVRYNAPYAHYQYYGRTMGPNVRTKAGWRSMAPPGGKYYTGGSLSYSGGRGGEWDRKMMAARGGALIRELAAYLGGTAE